MDQPANPAGGKVCRAPAGKRADLANEKRPLCLSRTGERRVAVERYADWLSANRGSRLALAF